MKHSTVYFVALAAVLLIVTCLPTGLSLDAREYVAGIVACLGAFLLGFNKTGVIGAVAATGLYFLLGLLLPRLIEGVTPGKIDMFSAYVMALMVCFAICIICYGFGSLARFIIAKLAYKLNPSA